MSKKQDQPNAETKIGSNKLPIWRLSYPDGEVPIEFAAPLDAHGDDAPSALRLISDSGAIVDIPVKEGIPISPLHPDMSENVDESAHRLVFVLQSEANWDGTDALSLLTINPMERSYNIDTFIKKGFICDYLVKENLDPDGQWGNGSLKLALNIDGSKLGVQGEWETPETLVTFVCVWKKSGWEISDYFKGKTIDDLIDSGQLKIEKS